MKSCSWLKIQQSRSRRKFALDLMPAELDWRAAQQLHFQDCFPVQTLFHPLALRRNSNLEAIAQPGTNVMRMRVRAKGRLMRQAEDGVVLEVHCK